MERVRRWFNFEVRRITEDLVTDYLEAMFTEGKETAGDFNPVQDGKRTILGLD